MSIILKCPRHPKYKARTAPTANCNCCKIIFDAVSKVQFAEQLEKKRIKEDRLAKRCAIWAKNYGKPPYYCNPAHCKRHFKTKVEMINHVDRAYGALG